ncbi:MAG: hypothetical protein ACYCYA_05260 [Actinomycetes bacterium]
MSDAITAAAVGSAAPTIAALLAYANARAARRQTEQASTASLAVTVEELDRAVQRTEAGIGRIEVGVGDLRERVARLEGRHDGPTLLARRPSP